MPFLIVAAVALIGSTIGALTALQIAQTALNYAFRPKPPKPTDPGRQITSRQSAAPRRIQYGRGVIGGMISYICLGGTSNEYLHMVITLTGCEIHSVDNMLFDGVSKGLGPVAGEFSTAIKLGAPGESAFADLIAVTSEWTSAHRQDSCAGVHVQLKYDAGTFPNGIPNITFEVHGREVYDPRDESTGYSENPALCIRDYLTASFGLGCSTNEIDDDSFSAAANICDETVALKTANTDPAFLGQASIPRYTCNGSFTLDMSRSDILNALLSSCAGQLTYVGGRWGLYVGAWRSSSLAVTDTDFRGPIKCDLRRSMRDTCNGVKATYISPANHWQMSDAPAYFKASYVAEDSGFGTVQEQGNWVTSHVYAINDCLRNDGMAFICKLGHTSAAGSEPGTGASWTTYWTACGERIWQTVELPMTISPATAQRLEKIYLEKTRRQITGQFPCMLPAYQLQPADTCTITHANFGWSSKTFEVLQSGLVIAEDANNPVIGVDLQLHETDSGVYAWTPASDETTALLAP